MKKLAIFDFDGTLFDSAKDVEVCFNKTLSIHGFPTLTHEEFLDSVGGNIDEMVSLILKDNNTTENIELIKDAYAELYGASPKDNTRPFPGTHEVLKELQERGMLLAINSNRSTGSIMEYVEEFFNDIDFAVVEGHNPPYPSKPSPCGVKKMGRKLKLESEEMIYIGDSMTDIKTARNAGIDCILVRWGYGRRQAFESDYPLEIVDDPYQILNYF